MVDRALAVTAIQCPSGEAALKPTLRIVGPTAPRSLFGGVFSQLLTISKHCKSNAVQFPVSEPFDARHGGHLRQHLASDMWFPVSEVQRPRNCTPQSYRQSRRVLFRKCTSINATEGFLKGDLDR